ncbi:type II toxin-antitoxin system HicB family antitoxin [Candidatus Poribacteria bacterium]|nr:type II toxin-antitoxin system HicB family antitoxin [Candidatus Poribacteria bacterium]MYA70266.1 type II toxin-antitoxin system HicB family antitoxin [Candidatus Poribacteria bacterium]MYC77065.1 type II toxin-antitoxin system HicB family antitoxin [Candidatus Poribacteria bacterium]
MHQKAIKGIKLNILLEEQPEGGFTITCRELPELLTECDSLNEMKDNVIDAFHAVVALYEHRKRPLPKEIQILDDDISSSIESQQLLETVVAFNEVSRSNQKVKTA